MQVIVARHFSWVRGLTWSLAAVVSLSACTPKSESDKPKGETVFSDEVKKDRRMIKRTDVQKVTEYQFLRKSLMLTQQAQQIFSESWKIALKDKGVQNTDKVQSVFSEAAQLMDAKRKKMEGEVASATEETCRGLKNGYRYSKDRNKKDAPYMEVQVQDCQGKRLNWIAVFREVDGSMEMYFNPQYLRNGAGARLLGLSLSDSLIVYCASGFVDKNQKVELASLRCIHLGQSLSREQHVEFKKFNFDRSQSKVLEFTTVTYGSDFVTAKKEECEKHISIPQNASDKITVHELCEATSTKQVAVDKNSALVQAASKEEKQGNTGDLQWLEKSQAQEQSENQVESKRDNPAATKKQPLRRNQQAEIVESAEFGLQQGEQPAQDPQASPPQNTDEEQQQQQPEPEHPVSVR